MEREETEETEESASVDNAGIVYNEGTTGGEAVIIEGGKDQDTGREESICDNKTGSVIEK